MNEAQQLLRELAQVQEVAREAKFKAHASRHADLGQEMSVQLERLSKMRQERHAYAGRVGPPVEGLLDREQVEARKARIMRAGGFRI